MASIEIHPQYRALLARQGLVTANDFLALEGVVCSGHLDRNVSRVNIGKESEAIQALLKREHRIRWRDRLANAWEGFGLVAKSRREFALLLALESTGIGSPQAIAVGEDDGGRAFLLVRELAACQDLRQQLEQLKTAPPGERRAMARKLGLALAGLHNSGFEHTDLYSKHILVHQRATGFCEFFFLDWQRGGQCSRVGWTRRWRDLTKLDASLADDLASPRLRLHALDAYLRASSLHLKRPTSLSLAAAAREVRRGSLRLLQRRRIREMRQPPMSLGTQNLIWVDGEALQVTREFRDELGGHIPEWLRNPEPSASPSVRTVPLPGPRIVELATRWASRPWRWLWAWLRRQPVVAPELESMKILLRLERYGVVMPRLLAAGQKQVKPWQMASFLLTEPRHGAIALASFLPSATTKLRRQVVGKAACALRQMHQATCYVRRDQHHAIGELLTVCPHAADDLAVALGTVHGIEKCHHPNPMRAQRDLAALLGVLSGTCSRSDLLMGLMNYIGKRRLTPATKRFARRVLERLRAVQPRRRAAA